MKSKFLLLFIAVLTKVSTVKAKGSSFCPENEIIGEEGYSYFHNATQQCYVAGTQGPCGKYMQWWGESENGDNGFCSCYSAGDRCGFKLHRPVARSIKDDMCYPAYDKANCNEGEWFTVDAEYKGSCTKNPCANKPEPELDMQLYARAIDGLILFKQREQVFPSIINAVPVGEHPWDLDVPIWYKLKGKCYKTFTRGHCEEDEIAIFHGTHLQPICTSVRSSFLQPCSKKGKPTPAQLQCPQYFERVGNDCIPPLASE